MGTAVPFSFLDWEPATYRFKQQIQLSETNSAYETLLIFLLFINWTLVLNCLQIEKKNKDAWKNSLSSIANRANLIEIGSCRWRFMLIDMNTPNLHNGVLVASATALPGTWATTGILSHYPIRAEDGLSLQWSYPFYFLFLRILLQILSCNYL